jgi:hypothetical protein
MQYLVPLEEQKREVPFGAPLYCKAPYTVSMVGAGYKVASIPSRFAPLLHLFVRLASSGIFE